MSTLEKAMDLLQTMPEQKIKIIYAFIRFMDTEPEETAAMQQLEKRAAVQSMLGMAHEYANPALIPLEKEAFANAMAEKHALDRR